MLHFIICDADAMQLKLMAEMTSKWAKANRLEIKLSQFNLAQELLAEYKPERNDIFILDISRPENDGLALGRGLRKKCGGSRGTYNFFLRI